MAARGWRCRACLSMNAPRKRKCNCGVWRQSKTKTQHGYIVIDRKYEHRLVAEEKIGRPLLPNEVVHHLNGVKDDNRPENLEVLSGHQEHGKLHDRFSHLTHCKQGHEFTVANTYVRLDTGHRQCKTCKREAFLRFHERRASCA